MGQETGIEWVVDAGGARGETVNPTAGCRKLSRGCRNCYAERTHTKRYLACLGGRGDKLPDQYRHPFHVLQARPERLQRVATKQRPTAFFIGSMSDVCCPEVPDGCQIVWAALGCFLARPDHTGFLLTKRPERLLEYYLEAEATGDPARSCLEAAVALVPGLRRPPASERLPWPPPNVWTGFSAENQEAFDVRAPHAVRVPAARSRWSRPQRFVSAEPLVGSLSIDGYDRDLAGVIAGGESGPGAEPCRPDDARRLLRECEAFGLTFAWKQWGEHVPEGQAPPGCRCVVESPLPEGWPDGLRAWRVGKEAAGKLLDGRVYSDLPLASARHARPLLATGAAVALAGAGPPRPRPAWRPRPPPRRAA